MKKALLFVSVMAALTLTGCASEPDEGVNNGYSSKDETTSRDYMQERVDGTRTKFIERDMPDGSTVICIITMGSDMADQDCLVIPGPNNQ